jgi:hypothetical protein
MSMQYFTRKWAEGKRPDSVRKDYLDNLYSIREELPSVLRELAYENLQGAKIKKLKIDKTNRIIQLKLICTDPETGPFDLDLTYDTVQLEDTDDAVLEQRAADPKTQILFDEIDLGKTGYEHRFLFNTGEARVTFRTLRTKKSTGR